MVYFGVCYDDDMFVQYFSGTFRTVVDAITGTPLFFYKIPQFYDPIIGEWGYFGYDARK